MPEIDNSSNPPVASVTVLGLGLMGTALADAFRTAGHRTTVWNRSPEKADPLVERGAHRADDAVAAVSASDAVVVCVSDYATARAVLAPAAAELRGKLLVNLTNGTPEQARDTAAWAAEQGADYIDGGIMAVPQMIAGPDALILYSGAKTVFDRHADLFAALGTARHLGEDPGLAPLFDLALLSGMYGMFTGFYQAVALVGSEKAEATDFTTTLLIPWVQAMVGLLPAFAAEIDAGEVQTDVANLDVNRLALANILDASRGQGVAGDLMAPLARLLDEAVADGGASHSLSSLVGRLSRAR
ncbi:MAG: NAD(P)-dependent oxidoreductase [Streptomycetaceae bacterium]|nr:NAD(P)-dependent oxidoreductase [Streptomycetaceae bacterium]